ncbi:deoxyribodipyrimidine photo-lyase [Bermanella marisrubri]|uniref:Deoxyribodipyrimidine photo-lyase n=1 Tax=Bermanella marisrubri TaxID=207949 RepID=Q1MZD6_9GAMM|nr:deoxyribodipyrimidine photo-lyase [Bermanella marisrubri]EAT11330.1 Deoxyribodipyrimidine photolyase [Oceanobacter sp. RED65] [Bermanella marisrubri]QIZ85283.1 deoxyribodipyrimidine photo-lyase [Bermanella marisrubri]
MSSFNAVWFRRDLRVHDNPALFHAMKNGQCIAFYCLAQKQWDEHQVSLRQRSLIRQQLEDLTQSLAALGVPLIVIDTADFKSIPKTFVSVLQQYNVEQLFCNAEYEVNEVALTKNVTEALQQQDIKCHEYHDQCLIQPGVIVNKQDQPYKVFTAFKKAYLAQLDIYMRDLYPLPKKQQAPKVKTDISALQSIAQVDIDPWQGSEQVALDALDEFCKDRIKAYKRDRDIPSLDGTSTLSPYLAIGSLSVRQCWQMSQQVSPSGSKPEGIATWQSELIWRDFYRHLIYFFPHVCQYKAFKQETDHLPWKKDQALFQAWCDGRTGYPLVDAAMRQLNQTGWMHNRLRMVAAMFLSKHLFIDWRLGEAYFMQQLIDGDLASNNGGWQWSASTGVDAVPYFRIFNPIRQSERFDSKGTFLRQYVPELASLDDKRIHNPDPITVKKLGYPAPIVDHKQAVVQTKQWFKELDASNKEFYSQESLI